MKSVAMFSMSVAALALAGCASTMPDPVSMGDGTYVMALHSADTDALQTAMIERAGEFCIESDLAFHVESVKVEAAPPEGVPSDEGSTARPGSVTLVFSCRKP